MWPFHQKCLLGTKGGQQTQQPKPILSFTLICTCACVWKLIIRYYKIVNQLHGYRTYACGIIFSTRHGVIITALW